MAHEGLIWIIGAILRGLLLVVEWLWTILCECVESLSFDLAWELIKLIGRGILWTCRGLVTVVRWMVDTSKHVLFRPRFTTSDRGRLE
jgi:hypothetical protein